MSYDRDAYQKNKADALFRMGFHSEVTGKTDDAIKKYQEAVGLCPDHYQSHIQLSRIYQRNGSTERATYHKERACSSRVPAGPSREARPEPVKRIEHNVSPGPVIGSMDPLEEDLPDPEGDEKVKGTLPLVWEAFYGRFEGLRGIQRRAAPVILSGANALIISSTAGGKTEAIFAPLAQRLITEGWTGLSIVYVSPTKALAADMRQRLEDLLTPLGLRAALRSGDAKEFDRNRPQDVLVTTPESLDSFLSTSPDQLRDVRAIVLDELHMVDGSYRGDQLRFVLKRMAQGVERPLSFYAASATVSDPDALAARYMPAARIVRSPGGRGIDYRILPSLDQALRSFREKGCQKGLVFCNTPQEAEGLANGELRRHFPHSVIRVHHGKLQAAKRLEAERALRQEERVVCACTSTLEVGVDIGDIDMIILANRPRSVSSIAQRIGRGNRRKDRISVMAVANTTGEAAYYEKIFQSIIRSKYSTDEYCLDPTVIVQQIFSVLAGSPGKDGSHFSALFGGSVNLGELGEIMEHLRSQGWLKRDDDGTWSATDKVRELGPNIYSNIPGSESIQVVEMDTEEPIGSVALPIDNIFILGGQAWLVRKRRADKVIVTKVEAGTEIANFASYDRFGAFFDLLPLGLRMKYKKERSKD